MPDEPKFRYPGVNVFTKEDSDIFCGRKDDSGRLFSQIFLNKMMILHGESGSGKSSLIQAGIIPLLETGNYENRRKYIPVTIRFEDKEDLSEDVLVRKTLAKIKEAYHVKDTRLPFMSPQLTNLWYCLKLIEAEGVSLLLIFDQFEEIQSYDTRQIKQFKKSLFEGFSTKVPDEIYDEISESTLAFLENAVSSEEARKEFNSKIEQLEKPLATKAVFVIREDKLGTMSSLTDYFPEILKNDYLLNPLTIANAEKAITDPAKLGNESGRYKSKPFLYDRDAVDHLVSSLKDASTDMVDPLQIQIVCSHIERNVASTKNKITIADIPPLENAIDTFYHESWRTVEKKNGEKATVEFRAKREFIIERLIVGEKRNLVHEDVLKDNLCIGIVKELTRAGLLREVPTGKDKYYQLCHDRFIKPAITDLTFLRADKKSIAEKEALKKQLEDTEREREEAAREREETERIKEQARQLEKTKEKEKLQKNRVRAAIVAIVMLVSVLTYALLANVAEKKAREQLDSANFILKARNIQVESARENAIKLAEDLQIQKGLSDRNAEKAEQKSTEATKQKEKADEQARLASRKTEEAQRNAKLARDNEDLARHNEEDAKREKLRADTLRAISLGLYLGAKASGYIQDKSVKLLLAMQAYQFNTNFKGYPLQKEIYEGLYRSLKYRDSSQFVFTRHQGNYYRNDRRRDSSILQLLLDSNGKVLFVCTPEGVYSFDIETKERRSLIESDTLQLFQSIAISPDGEQLYCGSQKALDRVDLATLRKTRISPQPADNLLVLENGSLLFTNRKNELFLLKDRETNCLHEFPQLVTDIIETNDSKLLISSGNSVKELNMKSLKSREVYRIPNITTGVVGATGNFLVGSDQGNIYKESPKPTSQKPEIIYKHLAPVTVLQEKGPYIFSLSTKTLSFWEKGKIGKLPVEITDFSSWALSLAVTPNLQFVFVGTYDGTILKFPITPGQMASKICGYAGRNLTESEWEILISKEVKYEKICPEK